MDMAKYLNTPGKRIKFLREGLGMLQKDLVAAVNAGGGHLAAGSLSTIERSNSPFFSDTCVALARILGTSTDFLLMLTDDPTPAEKRNAADYQPTPEWSAGPQAEEAVRLLEAMDNEHRDFSMSILRQLAVLARAKKNNDQYAELAAVLIDEAEKDKGEDFLTTQALPMLESRLPGASAVAIRLLRERGLQQG